MSRPRLHTAVTAAKTTISGTDCGVCRYGSRRDGGLGVSGATRGLKREAANSTLLFVVLNTALSLSNMRTASSAQRSTACLQKSVCIMATGSLQLAASTELQKLYISPMCGAELHRCALLPGAR